MSTASRKRRQLNRLNNRIAREVGKAFLKIFEAEARHSEKFMKLMKDKSNINTDGGTIIQESIIYKNDDWNGY